VAPEAAAYSYDDPALFLAGFAPGDAGAGPATTG
jgi:hypothetical protein